jgi:hypothetical protein
MERSKNYAVFGVLALIVSLVAVSLAYAGFTATLNINGTANVKAASWNVHFANLQNVINTGTAVEITHPTVTATNIGNYAVSFSTPGDSITYTFDVVNSGTFNAKWSGLTIGTPTCTGGSGSSNAQNVCNNLEYKLYEGSTNKTAADNSVLAANGGKKTYKIVLTYKSSNNTNVLPATNDVTISNLGVTFTYTQSS